MSKIDSVPNNLNDLIDIFIDLRGSLIMPYDHNNSKEP
jgi:hypothetical protein